MKSKSAIIVLSIFTNLVFAQIRLPKTNSTNVNNTIEYRIDKKKEKKESKTTSQNTQSNTSPKNTEDAEAEFDKLPSSKESITDDTKKLNKELYNKLLVDFQKDPKNNPPVALKSSIHQKYNKKIVWSNEEIKRDQPNESKFKNTFKVTEQIYGRMFFDKGIESYPLYCQARSELVRNHNSDPNDMNTTFSRLTTKYFLDGSSKPWYTGIEYVYTTDDPGNNNGQLYILPTGEDFWEVSSDPQIYNSIKLNVEKINSLPAGEHSIKVEVFGGDETFLDNYSHSTIEPIATGDFKIIKNANDMASDPTKYIKKMSFNEVKVGMKNSTLEAQMISVFKPYAQKNGIKGDVAKIKIRDTDWTIDRNELTGAIVGRSIYATLLIKENDNNCTMYNVSFLEDYKGGGKYSSIYAWRDSGMSYCDCNK